MKVGPRSGWIGERGGHALFLIKRVGTKQGREMYNESGVQGVMKGNGEVSEEEEWCGGNAQQKAKAVRGERMRTTMEIVRIELPFVTILF